MTRTKRRRIGIFGGSFDPPHIAHKHLVQETRSEFSLECVYIVPSKFPPGKEPSAPYDKRLEWTAEAFGEDPNLVISDLERSSETTFFGKDIFARLSLAEGPADFFWILGEDQWDRLPYWKDIDSYAKELVWLVTARTQTLRPSGLLSRRLQSSTCSYYWTKATPMLEVASHTIRESLVAEGEKSPAKQWIPKQILNDVLETYGRKRNN